MDNLNTKASAQWIKEPEYNHFQILDPYGWATIRGKKKINYHWFNEQVDRKEFEIRMSYSAVRDTTAPNRSWSHPWNNVVILENGNEVKARVSG